MPRNPYYGVIGNGETCAFVSPKGSIEWLCLPRFDGKIVYSRAIDPARGEALDVKVLENRKELLLQGSSQRYVSRTAVLGTVLKYSGLSVEITDFMPFNDESVFKSNQRRLFRIFNVKNESSEERTVEIKAYSGISVEKYRDVREGILFSDGVFIGVVFYGDPKLKIEPGKEAVFAMAVVYADSRQKIEKEMKRARSRDPQRELHACIGFWVNWFDRGKKVRFWDSDYENAYYNSLMTIKLLTHYRTGATVAAPTASFPATPGGVENWDYRYAWIRDNYFAARALLRSGHYDEVEKMLNFFYSIQGRNGHWESPLYAVDGRKLGKEIIIEELTGPGEEEEIRVGNAAAKQLQLDSEGSILHATYLYYLFTGDADLLVKHWNKIRKSAAWIAKNYSRKESGIWESRERTEHFLYGKVMCYAGLESAAKIAAVLGKRDEWKATRENLKKYIMKDAWSEQRQAFLQTFDDDAPADVSALVMEEYGLVSPDDARMRKTVRLIEQKLMKDGAVMRYENATLPFYLPTLWLASHYIKTGDRKRAESLIRLCVNSSTDLYLVAEHFDPAHGVQYGNFPQAFNAATLVEQTLNMIERKSMLHMLKIFEIDVEELMKSLIFDKHKLIEGYERAVGMK